MASRINLVRRLCSQALGLRKPRASASLLFLCAACTADDLQSNCNRKPLKILGPKELSHEALIRQACTLTANSSTQLLTQVLVAINDASHEYRKTMSEMMSLLEESLTVITNSGTFSVLEEVEDLIVHQRNVVEEQRKLTLELVSLMDYVEKMVTSAAETAFLAGAEPCSTLMCERLNSALAKVVEECAANKQSEEELLGLQEAYIIKLAEAQQKQSKRDEKNGINTADEMQNADRSKIVPVDIFGDLTNENRLDEEKDGLFV